MTGLRIAFAGTPEFALPALHALLGSRHSVVGVLTQPDRPKGRGRQVAPSPVKRAALERSIPVSQPLSLKQEADRADLAAWQPDVLVVVAYGLILPPAVLGLPRLGCLNIHASLLPRWRGAAPIQRAILAGDAQTGVCIMKMEAGLDTGPVYLRRVVPIGPEDTGGSLHDRLAAEGGSAMLAVLDEIQENRAIPTPQPVEGITYAAKIDKSEALIDWSQSALEIERKVRAFNPWPIAETRFAGEQLRIYRGRALEEASPGEPAAPPGSRALAGRLEPPANDGQPGTITAVRDGSILVACGSGTLALTELQRPGRRPVAARDLINTLGLTGARLG